MNHKKHSTLVYSLAALFLLSLAACQNDTNTKDSAIDLSYKALTYDIQGVKYQTGNWDHPNYTDPFTTNGNHRFEIKTKPGESLVQVILPWRRHDVNPTTKDVIITKASTGEAIIAKRMIKSDRESGHIVFKADPSVQSYYAYYLPHQSTGSYYPKVAYLTIEETADDELAKLTNDQISALPTAQVVSAQSIDDFHSFYPMEVIATEAEVDSFLQKYSREVYLFPEYRDYPIVMRDFLPYRWVSHELKDQLQDEARRSEFFTFQIGLFSSNQDLKAVSVQAGDLIGKGNRSISSDRITCFNTEGIDLNGQAFTKELNVPKGTVQALWLGLDIPEDTQPGIYRTKVAIGAKGIPENILELVLDIKPEVIANHGDDNPRNMTRLRWLNSTLGTDTSFIVPPFIPVALKGNEISLLGRKVTIGANGLPASIQSFFPQEMTYLKEEAEDILAVPITFDILAADGKKEEWRNGQIAINKSSRGQVNWSVDNESEHFNQQIAGQLEYDGMLNYNIRLVAKQDMQLANTLLQIPYKKDATKYMLGLGEKGRYRPAQLNWNWDINYHHEGLWLGNVNKGLQYVLRDENYERPLNTNFYHNKPLILPSSWGNEGKGGIRFEEAGDQVLVENYSGPRSMQAGDTLYYNIRFLITPFKTIDTKAHFSTRFVHKYVPVDTALAYGGTVINVHHANEINPYINYPFFSLEQQKAYIDEAHSKGVKVKLYNTIRELTYKACELHAMRSLGDEIFNDGEGGGHGWLQEHLVSNYHSAWHATRVNDAAILNKGTSRWTNYYIEGLNWLAKNQEIDGLYLDDIAFSRATVKRIVSVMNAHRDEVVIDLHSANQYNQRDGYINSVFLYMEHIPYVTRLWFGEYFDYAAEPDYWMTEVAGIPFGIPGEMLEKGGHPFRGMVYGMTTRVYGDFDPSALWKLFDSFGIADSKMMGYWVDASSVKTNKEGTKSTLYQKEDKAMIAIGSWSAKNELVPLEINWEALGWDKSAYKLYSPNIDGLQEYREFVIGVPIPVEKNEGILLVIEKKNDDS
jgi:hypothetical protein